MSSVFVDFCNFIENSVPIYFRFYSEETLIKTNTLTSGAAYSGTYSDKNYWNEG